MWGWKFPKFPSNISVGLIAVVLVVVVGVVVVWWAVAVVVVRVPICSKSHGQYISNTAAVL